MALVPCPVPAEITDVPDVTCPVELSRVRRVFFCQQLLWVSVSTAANPTIVELQTESEWVDTLAASDATKSLTTPRCGEFALEGGAPITAEFDGQVRNVGYDPTSTTLVFDGMPADTLAALKELGQYNTLYAMFLDQDNRLLHAVDGTKPNFFPLTPRSFFASEPSKTPDGLWLVNAGMQLEHDWYSGNGVVATVLGFDGFALSN